MFQNSFGRGWKSLSTGQKIFIAGMGLMVLYGVLYLFNQGGPSGFFSPARLLAAASIVLFALPVHEFAHAFTAVKLGDPTPRWQGRYTLNPLVHIDPMGAVLIFVAGFGWAKPVQWNPNNVTINRRLASVLVSVAGPLSNLLLAVITLVALRVYLGMNETPVFLRDPTFVENFLATFAWINVALAVFNLLPIPPLDGSHVLFALLPGNTTRIYRVLSQYGFIMLFAMVILAPDFIASADRGDVQPAVEHHRLLSRLLHAHPAMTADGAGRLPKPRPVRWTRARYRVAQFLRGFGARIPAEELAHGGDDAPAGCGRALPAHAGRRPAPQPERAGRRCRRASPCCHDLAAAALLHDVGKVAADDAGAYLGLWLRGPMVLVEAVWPGLLRRLASDRPAPSLRYALYRTGATPRYRRRLGQRRGLQPAHLLADRASPGQDSHRRRAAARPVGASPGSRRGKLRTTLWQIHASPSSAWA